MKKTLLKKYAEAIVKVGANVQKGQDVIIDVATDQAEFATIVADYAYKAGARYVRINFSYEPFSILRINKECIDSLSELKPFDKSMFEYMVERLPVRIFLISENPDGAKKLNHAKSAQVAQRRFPLIKSYREALENKYQWTIAGIPSKEWAKKVFPNLSSHQAQEKLFEAILKVTRIDDNPIEAWRIHNENLKAHMDYLNSLKLDYLHYRSSNGTDFKVWLNENVIWLAGGEKTSGSDIFYNPNMPTEEVFTSPIAGKAEGIVHASKPLSYNGQLIEDFYFVFKEGKVVEAHAAKNEPLLKQMISMDKGASMLGEVALVPFESPINQSGILFYNTLYDENAACHLALGAGFTNLYKDFEKYSKGELTKLGINDSMIHVDFMIGTADLLIEGHTKDGQIIPIFKNGTWAN